MPSIAQTLLSPLNERKRRREDASTTNSLETQMRHAKSAAPPFSHPGLDDATLTRRENSPPHHIIARHETGSLFNGEISESHLTDRKIIPKPRRFHECKRQRVEPSHLEDVLFAKELLGGGGVGSTNVLDRDVIVGGKGGGEYGAIGKVDLSPCHICRRKPTVRTELDAFANCEGCGRRTCYICIRGCEGLGAMRGAIESEDYDVLELSFHGEEDRMGWDGRRIGRRNKRENGFDLGDELCGGMTWDEGRMTQHKSMVCSRCCVERGVEGEVWCLGCLRAEEAG